MGISLSQAQRVEWHLIVFICKFPTNYTMSSLDIIIYDDPFLHSSLCSPTSDPFFRPLRTFAYYSHEPEKTYPIKFNVINLTLSIIMLITKVFNWVVDNSSCPPAFCDRKQETGKSSTTRHLLICRNCRTLRLLRRQLEISLFVITSIRKHEYKWNLWSRPVAHAACTAHATLILFLVLVIVQVLVLFVAPPPPRTSKAPTHAQPGTQRRKHIQSCAQSRS